MAQIYGPKCVQDRAFSIDITRVEHISSGVGGTSYFYVTKYKLFTQNLSSGKFK
jgi:hypothetical protein